MVNLYIKLEKNIHDCFVRVITQLLMVGKAMCQSDIAHVCAITLFFDTCSRKGINRADITSR